VTRGAEDDVIVRGPGGVTHDFANRTDAPARKR
jgi:hypothetical protein